MNEISETSLTFQDRSLLEVIPCYVFLQCGGDITYANRIAREALAAEAGEIRPVEEVFEGAFPGLAYGRSGCNPARRENVLGSATQPYTTEFECQLRAPGESLLPIHGSFRVLQANPEMQLLIIAIHGPRAAVAGETSNFLEQLLNAAPEAIMITRGARILHVNREFERLFGFTADEALGRNTFDILIPETRRHEFDMLEHTIQLHGRASMETVRLSKAGELIDVSVLVAPIELSGVTVGNFVSYRDIRDKKRTDAKLQYDALHDSLTGLANRSLFLDRMQLVMARQGRRQDLKFAVMFLDLDRFKTVNDGLGHACGDELLMKIAARLQACFRPEDTLARFGGDEFAVLIEDIAGVSDAARIAERVQQDIRLPVEIYGHEVLVTASIGIAFGTVDHTSPEQVLRDADYAMYQAKSRGNAHHEIFDGSMHVSVAARIKKEQDLRNALECREFEVWYQPIYHMQTGDLEGFESLLRWRRSNGEMVALDYFLREAEDTGLIVPIGFSVLEEVASQMSRWAVSVPARSPTVSINLSPRQLKDPQLLERISEVLIRNQIAPGRLRLEITENAIHEDTGFVLDLLKRLVESGVSLALDNFGSGLASLTSLVRLPLDLVKVDRRLTAYLPTPGRQAAILQTIFDLGRLLEVRILAEGIERPEQLAVLPRYGCDLVQGHLFSPAVEKDAAESLLRRGHWQSELNNLAENRPPKRGLA